MTKAKDPKRVAAGRKAYATAKRRGTAVIGGNPGKKRSGKPKLPSLAKSITIIGGVVVVTGLAADRVGALVSGLNDMATEAGIPLAVSGVGVVLLVNALKALASFWKGFGRRYRAFLRGYGLRP